MYAIFKHLILLLVFVLVLQQQNGFSQIKTQKETECDNHCEMMYGEDGLYPSQKCLELCRQKCTDSGGDCKVTECSAFFGDQYYYLRWECGMTSNSNACHFCYIAEVEENGIRTIQVVCDGPCEQNPNMRCCDICCESCCCRPRCRPRLFNGHCLSRLRDRIRCRFR